MQSCLFPIDTHWGRRFRCVLKPGYWNRSFCEITLAFGVSSGPFLIRESLQHVRCGRSTNRRVVLKEHAPVLVYYCWRLSECSALIGQWTTGHVLTRAWKNGLSYESQHLKRCSLRWAKHTLIRNPTRWVLFFASNNCNLIVEYVGIRLRMRTRNNSHIIPHCGSLVAKLLVDG